QGTVPILVDADDDRLTAVGTGRPGGKRLGPDQRGLPIGTARAGAEVLGAPDLLRVEQSIPVEVRTVFELVAPRRAVQTRRLAGQRDECVVAVRAILTIPTVFAVRAILSVLTVFAVRTRGAGLPVTDVDGILHFRRREHPVAVAIDAALHPLTTLRAVGTCRLRADLHQRRESVHAMADVGE